MTLSEESSPGAFCHFRVKPITSELSSEQEMRVGPKSKMPPVPNDVSQDYAAGNHK